MSNMTLLPSNESDVLKAQDVAYRDAWVDHTDQIDFDPHSCVPAMLPHLAKAYNMPYWDMHWRENIKRALVAEARELHKHAGTPWCLMRILEIMGLSTQEKPAIIIEYGDRDQYRVQLRRDGTHRYDSSNRHNGNEYIYAFGFGHWSEFAVVIKVETSRTYIKYAMHLMEMFKPTHTKLIGVGMGGELPTRDGVRYQYNGVYTHGGTIIRNGGELIMQGV